MAFAAPLLLAAMAAIGIPLFLHLMAKDVPKVVHFPSLRFIKKDKLETHSKRGLRDLLLLLMRCLVIAGVVFAFSQPFIKDKTSALNGATRQTVVLLDVSSSMDRKLVLDKIRERLEKEIGEGESVALITSAASRLSRQAFDSRDVFFTQLEKVKFTQEEGHHEESLNDAASFFAKEASAKKLIIVSDFQANDWNFLQTPQVGKDIELKFIRPFDKEIDNVSVLVNKVRRLNEGKVVQVQALVENHTALDKAVDVTFTAGIKTVKETLNLSPREKRRVILTVKDAGVSKAKVFITPDEYPADDLYHVWIGEEAPQVVLYPVEKSQTLDYLFVEKALHVKSADGAFRVAAREPSNFNKLKLEEFHAIILSDSAASLNEADFLRIKSYTEQGGLIIVAPGEKAGIVFSRLKAYGIADVTYVETIRRKSSVDLPFNFSKKIENSPLLKMFKNTPDSDLLNFAIYRYNAFKTGADAKNILSIKAGTPAWSLIPSGKGHVLVSAIPFNHVWSDFTLSNSFLPLLRHSIISLSGGASKSTVNLKVGERKLLAGKEINTAKPGAEVLSEVLLVVNVSRLESSVDTVNLIDFKSQIRASRGTRITVTDDKQSGDEYWHYFMLLAIGALLLEFAIADLFRKKTAQ